MGKFSFLSYPERASSPAGNAGNPYSFIAQKAKIRKKYAYLQNIFSQYFQGEPGLIQEQLKENLFRGVGKILRD